MGASTPPSGISNLRGRHPIGESAHGVLHLSIACIDSQTLCTTRRPSRLSPIEGRIDIGIHIVQFGAILGTGRADVSQRWAHVRMREDLRTRRGATGIRMARTKWVARDVATLTPLWRKNPRLVYTATVGQIQYIDRSAHIVLHLAEFSEYPPTK